MYELQKQGDFLTVYFPVNNTALVFRIIGVENANYKRFIYGALPTVSGQSMSTFTGGSSTAPANGVFPANSFSGGMLFPPPVVSGSPLPTYDPTDIWYIPPENRNHLFHVIPHLTPGWLRTELQIPINVSQSAFQVDRVVGGVQSVFGFGRGRYETVIFPYIHYGWRFGNDTSMTVYTRVVFEYAEYIVEIPRDANLIANILTRRFPSYEVTLPLITYPQLFQNALKQDYGITQGFTVPRQDQIQSSIRDIQSVLNNLKQGV
jgi:hypothetical protein